MDMNPHYYGDHTTLSESGHLVPNVHEGHSMAKPMQQESRITVLRAITLKSDQGKRKSTDYKRHTAYLQFTVTTAQPSEYTKVK